MENKQSNKVLKGTVWENDGWEQLLSISKMFEAGLINVSVMNLSVTLDKSLLKYYFLT